MKGTSAALASHQQCQVEQLAGGGVDKVDMAVDPVVDAAGMKHVAHFRHTLGDEDAPRSPITVCRVTVFPCGFGCPPPG